MEIIVSDRNNIRFDDYLVKHKFVSSRHQANDLIKRAQVKLNDKIITKPAVKIDEDCKQRIQLLNKPYVSRGGYKLESAFKNLKINVERKIVFDVGAHLGGFSDCCLRFGARQVVAIDVGSQKVDSKLLAGGKIIAFNKTDIRNFKWPTDIDLPDLIVVDASFISLKTFLNQLKSFCHCDTEILVLAKPQFETEAHKLNKGIVSNRLQRQQILEHLELWFRSQDWKLLAKTDSGITGLKGNLERFYLLKPIHITT